MTSQLESRSVRTQSPSSDFAVVKEIQLEAIRAQSWLTFLEAAQDSHSLSSFVEMLDEAIWLANWKREYVRLDVDLADIPVVLSYVAGIDAPQHLAVQEDILKSLSKL